MHVNLIKTRLPNMAPGRCIAPTWSPTGAPSAIEAVDRRGPARRRLASLPSLCLALAFSLPVITLSVAAPGVHAAEIMALKDPGEPLLDPASARELKSVAILPFDNYTTDPIAVKFMLDRIRAELAARGVRVAPDEDVERFLSSRRIRKTDSVTRLAAREMEKELGVDAILVGSVDGYSDYGNEVRAGVTARLVGAADCNIFWADTAAYAGRDFEGVLGLGRITTMDGITDVTVKALLRDVPARFPIMKLSPFEVGRVALTPSVGRAGEKISVKVNIVAVGSDPMDTRGPFASLSLKLPSSPPAEPVAVRGMVSGKDFLLTKTGDGVYEGSFAAPENEDLYYLDVAVASRSPQETLFKSVAKFHVDNTPPVVKLDVDKKVFTSRMRGQVIFTPVLFGIETVDEWRIEILDGEGKVMRSDKGYRALPRSLVWKGESNKLSMLDDGEYTYRFYVQDEAGNTTVKSDKLTIKNTPPAISVDISLDGETLVFTFAYKPGDVIDSWKFSVLDNGGGVVQTFEGMGDLPPRVEVPVLAGVVDVEKLNFSLSATDDAGNLFTITQSVPAYLYKKEKFSKREKFSRLKGEDKFMEDF
jgi:TolB-like protein